jgi:hypothetical protein
LHYLKLILLIKLGQIIERIGLICTLSEFSGYVTTVLAHCYIWPTIPVPKSFVPSRLPPSHQPPNLASCVTQLGD